MAESASLQPITSSEQRQVAERLWQLYVHDLSEFRGYMPGDSGLYETARLASFFDNPDRCGYLTYSSQGVAGFALIRGLAAEMRVMGEFFVVRAARRQRVGRDAAIGAMRLHPGKWGIPFQEENAGAARFWRRICAEVATTGCDEERKFMAERPEESPDTWLRFSIAT